ncbi:MAG TPA: dihydrolipoyl dehydrogenase [Candidatus Thermoplasmatota archaeon]|nr:dihydrolipoyl dehydrogenase [Candidatus Thermoplasmatota archaeon]
MKTYDVIVVGSGSGGEIVDAAISHGMTVAWVDKGPLGGTCLNVGCIPSKILIHPADRIMEIQEAKKLGITSEIKDIDFHAIMERVQQPIRESHKGMEQGIQHAKNLEYYKGEGHFIKDYTLEILGKEIKGEKIFLGSGARPLIPPITGLNSVPYLTNENVFDLKEKPDSMVIIGGGYVAVEFAHFFSAVGTKVSVFQRGNRLIPKAEPEISELLQKQLMKRMNIYLNTEVTEVKKQGDEITVIGKDTRTGKVVTKNSLKVFVAAGRQSNADSLKVENTGVKTDSRGYIQVNEYLQTSKENIWAFGDAIGKEMFKHVANEEATIVWRNAFHDHKTKMDYHTIPYAVFTYPEIASVGMTQEEATKNNKILIGSARYSDVAKGEAMMEHDGFTKAIVDKQTEKILGFHIIGPYASILIQEVINAMALGGDIQSLAHGMHIHPALPELILRTLGNLQEVS